MNTPRKKNAGPPIFADIKLARRLEAGEVFTMHAYVASTHKNCPDNKEIVLKDVAGGVMLYAIAGSPANHAVGMGMRKPVTKRDIARAERFYFSRNAPVEISVCPITELNFAQMLGARGYRITEYVNVLYRNMQDWKPVLKQSKGLKVSKNRPEDAEIATNLIADGFTDHKLPPAVRATMVEFQRLKGALCYMAYVGGKPVASSSGLICPKLKLAMLYGSSTLPKFRNRRAQSVMIEARLKEARAAGCELATISTFPGTTSQHNAERIGFRVAYTKLTFVKDPPK